MKMPSRAASIAYSGQCLRQVGVVSAAAGIGMPPLPFHSNRRCEHAQVEPERLAHRPGLERTPAGRIRRIGVRDLGDVSHSTTRQMLDEWVKEAAPSLVPGVGSATVYSYPSLHERTEEPRPHGALVIGPVPRENASLVATDIALVVARESSETEWSPEPGLNDIHHRARQLAVEHRVGKATDGEQLVGTKGPIGGSGHVVHVHHVVQVAC